MDSIVGLIKVARLYNSLFGKVEDVVCISCKKKYKKWIEYCEKCGSDNVVFLDPRKNEGQHFLNLPEKYKQMVINNVVAGDTAEEVRQRLQEANIDKDSIQRIYYGQKFAIKLVAKAKAEQSEKTYELKGDIQKRCPFCAELILYQAVVCKHCGRDLPDNSVK